jgi:phospholipid/cholesterol/gamma-HCH transport system permease protein
MKLKSEKTAMVNSLINIIITVGSASAQIGRDMISIITFVGEMTSVLFRALLRPAKIRWRETFYYMDMCGADALPIVTLICFLMGLILGFQAAAQLKKFGSELLVADLVGCSIVKELGPLMVAMIATGRAGSSFAAEIGTMRVNEEVDAMVTMGFIPHRFIAVPKILAMVVVMPLLTVFGDIVGVIGGMIVGVYHLNIPIITYYNRTISAITPMFFVEGIFKSVVFAILIAGIGCLRGFEAKSDAQGVGRAATSAVVSGIFLIVLADTVCTLFFTM